ncbi:hypothetical protein ABTM87_18940, partial [Acinetobacter baumannii]
MAFIDLEKVELDEKTIGAVPAETAQAYQIVPTRFDPPTRRLEVAMKSADNFRAVDDLQLLMGFKVSAFVADPAQVDRLLKKHYSKTESVT